MMTFHAPSCPIMGEGHPALPVDKAREEYPVHNFDIVCAAGIIVPYVIVELAATEHDYEPSDVWPDDAERALCRKCFGTHGPKDGNREVITIQPETQRNGAPGLILPPDRRRKV